jgi:hypothetical protein
MSIHVVVLINTNLGANGINMLRIRVKTKIMTRMRLMTFIYLIAFLRIASVNQILMYTSISASSFRNLEKDLFQVMRYLIL